MVIKMNKLVVYFTYSGHTEKIVNLILDKIPVDVLKLNPIVPYSTDYDKVVEEEQNTSNFSKTVEIEKFNVDFSKYDEIILGFGVWWYSIPPVIRTFLKENDLRGKKIIPFATNAGWLGRTFQEIRELCPNSIVTNEMNIVFKSYTDDLVTSSEEINKWINSL